jgi:hypothetical protein
LPVDAAYCNDDSSSRRIFVTDVETNTSFLINTGADVCVYPRSKLQETRRKDVYKLFAINGMTIATYGTIPLTLNLRLRRQFKWHFVVADVHRPIIGMDFLSHYGLLVDPRNKRLIDQTTNLSAAASEAASIKTIIGDTNYHRLLAEYPDVARPPVFGRETTRHGVVHHIRPRQDLQSTANHAASLPTDSSW